MDLWGSGRTHLPVKQTVTARTFESMPGPPFLRRLSSVGLEHYATNVGVGDSNSSGGSIQNAIAKEMTSCRLV
jgi:hypothetical protein